MSLAKPTEAAASSEVRAAAPYLSLSENLALVAGAGAGKTHSLISLALHALGGARRDRTPIPPARLAAVTFTEKAAAEMKDRLRQRVRALADGEADEPDLSASFAWFGIPEPTTAFWEKVHADLSSAFVGTFHSLCADLLRRRAVEAGLDPRLSLMDEAGAQELFERAAERSLLRDLEGEGPRRDRARRLLRSLGLRGRGEHGAGLVEALARLHSQLAEDGASAGALPTPAPERSFARAREALVAAIRAELARAPQRGLEDLRTHAIERLGELDGIPPEGARRALAIAAELRDCIDLRSVPRADKERLKALRDQCLSAFEQACAEELAAPLQEDLGEVLRRVEERYRAEKERRGALDFADLIRSARDLLRGDGALRREEQDRIGVLLVDEFQDTNRLQLDLVALLCERREGAPRAVEGRAFDVLPLEPGLLACVGDPKQSIYEFRGADVSVFGALAARLEAGEGRVEYLRQNRRSRPALLAFFNALFTQILAPSPRDPPWRIGYDPAHDDLTPWRPAGPPGPCAELLLTEGASGEERRALEARGVAERIAVLLAPGAPPAVGRDRAGEELRPAQGRDIAVLFRRFTHLELFRRELAARSIPHVVIRGSGFFRTPEVVDLRGLLSLLGNPSDRFALACALRSPLVALSDSSLARLALERRLSLSGLAEGLDLVGADERERARNFLALWSWLRPASARIPVWRTLEAAIAALDFEAVLAAGPEGEQRVANARKLVDWARRENPPDPWSAARRLEELAALQSREAQAQVLDESDPLAVRLMTIHQSKGLEFPIVFVPECGAAAPAAREVVLYDRELGLCIRPTGDDGRALATSASARIGAALASRQAAESERLLYVAATRARDLLVLSGGAARKSGTWREHLDAFAAGPEGASLTLRAAAAAASSPLPVCSAAQTEVAALPAPAAARRPRSLRSPALALTLSQVLDHASCPRRFELRHLASLAEAPSSPLARELAGPASEGEPWEALLQTKPFRGLGPSGGARAWRSVPAALRVPIDGGAAIVRGRLDLLAVLGDGSAAAVGVSALASSSSDEGRVALWLAWLASAGRALFPPEVPVRAALGFSGDGAALELAAPAAPELAALESAVQALAARALSETKGELASRQEPERCRALRCGYARFCGVSKSRKSESGALL